MSYKFKQIHVKSNGRRVTFSNITDEVKDFISNSGIENGICVVSSPHTTCSVVFDEFTHDKDWNGDELLQVDLVKILDKVVPRELTETDYLYPGPKHVAFLKELNEKDPSYDADPATILNADAHIRASLFGSSQTIIINQGVPLIGSVGYLYFVDWDQNRTRTRKCNLAIIGD
ncbi:YjbQ family protein [Lacticaseibacillus hegangensis]|uniref:YjbQ family protein n=1 Tax=Lacticaseibacillus hegangensis TaxID=2486010 RepID=A0ABW4CXX4_9LACO|nr:YjbQ family protein [Lacticaseibacillus hegangensis]